jgi:predicted ATP-grasp superfamily ATP-dependent carboligase
MLMDKPSFYEYAIKNKLPVAKYRLLHSRKDAEDVVQTMRFPCTIKPPIKSPLWEKNTKIKAYKINDEQEFFEIYEMCKDWSEVLMAQEWIEGTDTDLYSCNCYFNDQNKPLVSFVSKKLRQYPPVTGNTSLGVECRCEAVRDISLKLFKKVNYYGLGYVELKRDVRDGKYYIIEPNVGRPTGRSALAEACGVEILYTMYCDILDLTLPEQVHQIYKGVKWIQIRTDLISSFYYWKNGELTISDWWRSLKGPKFFAVFALKDPMPILVEFFTGLKFIWNKAVNKLFKKPIVKTKST